MIQQLYLYGVNLTGEFKTEIYVKITQNKNSVQNKKKTLFRPTEKSLNENN